MGAYVRRNRGVKGFTLVEILLVVVILGIMLAVIAPRAWRANVDTKYGLVRQSATELASYAIQWAESQILAQTDQSTATMNQYLTSLCGGTAGSPEWVGGLDVNWNNRGTLQGVIGRNGSGVDAPPEVSVEGVVPPEKSPRNPFNGTSCFRETNMPANVQDVVPGALAGAFQPESGGWNYFALLFQGTDSAVGSGPSRFHAGQTAGSLQGVRNGIFLARTK